MCQVLDPLKFPASGFTPTQNLLIQPLPRGERREEVRDYLLYHGVWVLPYRSPPHPVKGHVGQAGMEAKSIEWLSGPGGRGNAKEWQAGLLLCHCPGLRIIVSLCAGSVEREGVLQGVRKLLQGWFKFCLLLFWLVFFLTSCEVSGKTEIGNCRGCRAVPELGPPCRSLPYPPSLPQIDRKQGF